MGAARVSIVLSGLLVGCGGHAATPDAAIDSTSVDASIDASTELEAQVAVVVGTDPHGSQGTISAVVVAGSVFGAVLGSDGPCTRYTNKDSGIHRSAGTVAVTGTTVDYTVTPSGMTPYVSYTTAPTESLPLFAEGATIDISAAGSSDFPAFAGTVTGPAAITGFTGPTTVSRAGYTATWTAGSGPKLWVMLIGFQGSESSVVICHVDDTGSYAVAASSFALFPPGYDQVGVVVARVSETQLTTPRVSLLGVNELASYLAPLTP